MAKRISILVALEGADEGLKRAITSAERSLGELSTTAKTAGAKAAAGMAGVKPGTLAFRRFDLPLGACTGCLLLSPSRTRVL